MEAAQLVTERRRRRLATNGLIVDDSLTVHDVVGVLLLPVVGARQAA